MDDLMAYKVSYRIQLHRSFDYTRTYLTNLPLNPELVTTAECTFLVNSVSYRANQDKSKRPRSNACRIVPNKFECRSAHRSNSGIICTNREPWKDSRLESALTKSHNPSHLTSLASVFLTLTPNRGHRCRRWPRGTLFLWECSLWTSFCSKMRMGARPEKALTLR